MKKHIVTVGAMTRGAVASAEQKRLIGTAVLAVLDAENVDMPCSVAVSTTDDVHMRKLNRDTRNVDRATDVLSFPMFELVPGEKPAPKPWEMEDGRTPLGDIVISLERAAAQSVEYGHTVERELAFLAVHAVLHLLGYDHERGADDEKLHFARQQEILEGLGLER